MSEFKIYNAQAEDLSRYPDFFAQAPLFNTLNQIPQIQNYDQNIISRMTSRTVEKIVFYEKQPVFFLSYRKSTVIHAIETMIYDPRVSVDETALFDFIRTECFDKMGLSLGQGKFEHHTCDQPLNESVMTRLGFERRKNHRVMNLLLDYRISFPPQEGIMEYVEIRPVSSERDIQDRVDVQNNVFQNRNRIPLVWLDVQTEMRNKSYVPDLSLIMYYDQEPCGYGQIVSNSSAYYLVNFGIDPQFQGRGLAHILLDWMLAKAQARGIAMIKLEVYEDNLKATTLYEKHGFKTMYNKSQWIYSRK